MITVENLVYRYDVENSTRAALDGITLTVKDDEWLILAGANGSGKTTLVRQFNGLLTPDDGRVLVDGVSVSENPVRARTRVGMVFQSPDDQFVATTVGTDVAFGPENLGLTREEIDRRVEESLAAVNLSGYEDRRIDSLSGGEKARVALAGALAMEPSYLVCDEPLVGLDWPARESVLAHLDTLADAGTAIIFVTHDVRDVLDRADRVIGLRDGVVAFSATPANAIDRLETVGVRPPDTNDERYR